MYMDIQWIKLAVQFYKDEDIRLIRKTMPDGDTITLMFVMLLAMAGERNQSGCIPYTDEELSVLLDIPINTVRLGLRVMLEKEMIDNQDGIIHITNWDKYQSVDGMDKIRENREKDKLRKREARAKAKAIELAASAPALPASPGFAPEEELMQIHEEHNLVLDAAKKAGFPDNEATWDMLVKFYGEYGKEAVLEGIEACVLSGKPALRYLQGCLRRSAEEKKKAANQKKDGPRYDDQGREIWDEY